MPMTAAEIQDAHARTIDAIRSRTDLTAEGKRDRIAAAHDDYATRMTQLQQAATVHTAVRRGELHQRAFGPAGLAGDPATTVVSVRDAQDRAARLQSPDEAAALLQRAELSGDEALARAVGEHAFRQAQSPISGAVWVPVVQSFADRRERAADAINKLAALDSSSGVSRALSDAATYYLPTPSELQGTPGGWRPSMATTSYGGAA